MKQHMVAIKASEIGDWVENQEEAARRDEAEPVGDEGAVGAEPVGGIVGSSVGVSTGTETGWNTGSTGSTGSAGGLQEAGISSGRQGVQMPGHPQGAGV